MTPIVFVWTVVFSPAGTPAEWAWRFDSPAEVTGSSNLSLACVSEGVFCGMTAWDPHFSLDLRGEILDAKTYSRMTLRLYSSKPADHVAVYYKSPNGQWGLGKSLPVAKGWAVYRLDLNRADWHESGGGTSAQRWGGSTGKVVSLRIDPGNQADRWIVVDDVRLLGGNDASFQAGVVPEPTTAGKLVSCTGPPNVTAGETIDVAATVDLDAPLAADAPGFVWLCQAQRPAKVHTVRLAAGQKRLQLRASVPTSLAAFPADLGVRIVVPGVRIDRAGPETTLATVRLANPRAGTVRPPLTTVARVGGDPTLLVDGKPTAPFFYTTSDRCPGRGGLWHREIAGAGVHLYADWFGTSTASDLGQVRPGVYDYGKFDAYFAEVLEIDPEARFLPHVGITPPRWWQEAHPQELCTYADGKHGPQSFASRRWRRETADDLRHLIRHLQQAPYADRILGYIPYSGYSAEWQSWGLWRDHLADYSAPAVKAWRRWLQDKYADDASLRRAWGRNDVSLASATPPSPEQRHHADLGVLRDPVGERQAIDYYAFLADLTADAIIHFARVTKGACGRRSLVGTYYGYLTQHGQRQQDSSHLALARVLRSPDVDFLMSPPLYTDRQLTGTSGFMSTAESVRLHGKLWLSEADYRTSLSDPGAGYGRAKTLEGSQAILLREMGNVLTRRTAVSWFDMRGGWFSSPAILDELGRMRAIHQASLAGRGPFHGDVAVFVDEESFTYLRPMHRINSQLVLQQIIELPRVGAAWDFYLLSDVDRADLPGCKLYVFLNAVKVGAKLRAAIHRRLRRDCATAVWIYAAGYYDDRAFGVERIAELTGVRVRQTPWDRPLWLGDETGPLAGADVNVDPVFVVDDPDAAPMSVLRGTDLVGLARKPQEGWTSVFCAVPTLRPSLLRRIARRAGCHVYLETGDAFAVDDRTLCIHASSDGVKTVTLPRAADVTDAMTGRSVSRAASRFPLDMKRGQTRLLTYRPTGT